MRVYVGARFAELRALADTGELGLDGRPAYAVTPTLLAAAPDLDDHELEWAAMMAAARECAEPRRVVVAADVRGAACVDLAAEDDPGRVDLFGPLRLDAVAAFHLDLDDGPHAVDDDLAWFATQELDDLL